MGFPAPAPGSIAIVTGASSGLGVEIAKELAKRGHSLALVAFWHAAGARRKKGQMGS